MRKTLRALLLKLTGKPETEIDAALDEAGVAEEAAPDPTPAPPMAGYPANTTQSPADLAAIVQQAIAPFQAELKQVKDALAAEATQRQAAQQALEAQQAREREASITKALDEAVTAGRIAPAKRDDWKARLEKDFDGVSAILGELPANPALGKTQTKAADKPSGAPKSTTPEGGSMLGGLRGDVLSYVQQAEA